jgi:hypothetical protein
MARSALTTGFTTLATMLGSSVQTHLFLTELKIPTTYIDMPVLAIYFMAAWPSIAIILVEQNN